MRPDTVRRRRDDVEITEHAKASGDRVQRVAVIAINLKMWRRQRKDGLSKALGTANDADA